MTNNENDTPVTDGTPPEAETAEAPAAAQPQDDAAKLADQLAAVQQDLLYARAETQNVRRSEEHTSELQSLMRISYAVFYLKKTKAQNRPAHTKKNHN